MSGTKAQWLEKTGGFRIGESPGEFAKRVKKKLGAGTAKAKAIVRKASKK